MECINTPYDDDTNSNNNDKPCSANHCIILDGNDYQYDICIIISVGINNNIYYNMKTSTSMKKWKKNTEAAANTLVNTVNRAPFVGPFTSDVGFKHDINAAVLHYYIYLPIIHLNIITCGGGVRVCNVYS